MSEPVILAIIAAVGSSSWLVTLARAWFDHRDRVSSREADADERYTRRLERRADDAEDDLEAERGYTAVLASALAAGGLPIPPRPSRRSTHR